MKNDPYINAVGENPRCKGIVARFGSGRDGTPSDG